MWFEPQQPKLNRDVGGTTAFWQVWVVGQFEFGMGVQGFERSCQNSCMTKKRSTAQKTGQRKLKAKRKAAKRKREDFSQAASRVVREATENK
jgi:hypothetical protein